MQIGLFLHCKERSEKKKMFKRKEEQIWKTSLEKVNWKEIQSILYVNSSNTNHAELVVEWLRHRKIYQIHFDCIEKEEQRCTFMKSKGISVIGSTLSDIEKEINRGYRYDLVLVSMSLDMDDSVQKILKILQMTIEHNGCGLVFLFESELNSLKEKKIFQKLCDENQVSKIQIPETSMSKAENMISLKLENKVQNQISKMQNSTQNVDLFRQYEEEIEQGISLIEQFQEWKKNCKNNALITAGNRPLFRMTIDGYYDCSVNEYIEKVRRKYWKIYFDELKREKDIPDHLLPGLNSMERIGFSPDAAQEIKKKADSPETDQMSELLRLFDLCSKTYSWCPESKNNVHYFDAWAANKYYQVNGTIVLPVNIYQKNRYTSEWSISLGKGVEYLKMIEDSFLYLGGTPCQKKSAYEILEDLLNENSNGKTLSLPAIQFRFFRVKFYKKGTCHIEFTDRETLKKFNIVSAIKKGWLPDSYGKKHYSEMTNTEQEIIRAFQGEMEYEYMLCHAEKYLYA